MTDQSKPYTPLTADNSALVLVDHQVGLMTGVRDYETGELKHNVVALAKAAKVLRVPTVVTTTARDSMWGPTFPELVETVGGEHIIDRSSVSAWDDPKAAAAIEATGRKILKDNASPLAGPVYGALDMPWATLVGQIAKAYGK